MLVSDTLAALSTLTVLFLLKSGQLRIVHLYLPVECSERSNEYDPTAGFRRVHQSPHAAEVLPVDKRSQLAIKLP